MTERKKIRVAAAQYHVGTDVDENLATTLRMMDQAAQHKPDLLVLPEFCNHLSWYNDKQHCFDVSVTLDGAFLAAVAAKVKALGFYVVVNCTVQRSDGTATGSSLLYAPGGELVGDNTKQIYIGHENDFLEKAQAPGPIVETPVGRLAMYACMDGVINETPRDLSLRGAQILCNSLNSFATDEGSLHIPVRAAENRVFVVAANKIGPLVPETMVAPISEATGIPPEFLGGAGDSQIVSPDGEVLAHAKTSGEEIVVADINPQLADQKQRPDGTDVFLNRRPELYQDIARDPQTLSQPDWLGGEQLHAAIMRLESVGESGLRQALQNIKALDRDALQWLALPPLVDAAMAAEDLDAAEAFSQRAIEQLAALAGDLYISTSLVCRNAQGMTQYCAVLIGGAGVVLQQGQMHFSERFAWSALSNELSTLALPFARVALVTSDDSIYPEMFRLAALAGVEVAAVPLEPLQSWELQTGLLERSAENRINLLVASMDNNLGESFATQLQTDFTVMTEWKERPFDGLLSQPIWHQMAADDQLLRVTLAPSCAENKEVSRNTHLLDDRPWALAGSIVRTA
mgnify:CR=1 FL=1